MSTRRPSAATGARPANRRQWLGLVAALASVVGGCRCFNFDREGAVSPELAQCRHYAHLSIAALERGDVQQAERLSSQAVEAFPADAQARRCLADALWRRGKSAAAIEQLEIARTLAADDPTLLVQLGEMLLALEQWERARTLAAEALDADPQAARAWLLRGDTFRSAGRFDEALADYTRAAGLEPENPHVLRRLSVVSLSRRQPQRALAYARSLVDAYSSGPVPADAFDLKGQILAEMGRWTDAKNAYAQAVAAAATPDRLCRLAEAELLAGQPNAARQTLDRVLSEQPRHADGLALRSRLDGLPPLR